MRHNLSELAEQAGSRTPDQARADIAASRGLPPGKTREEALERAKNYARILWSRSDWLAKAEDARIEELERYSTALYRGDAIEGARLAQDAIWGM